MSDRDPDWLESEGFDVPGPAESAGDRPPRRGRRRWWWLAAVLGVTVAVVVVLVVRQPASTGDADRPDRPPATSLPSSTLATSAGRTVISSARPAPAGPTSVGSRSIGPTPDRPAPPETVATTGQAGTTPSGRTSGGERDLGHWSLKVSGHWELIAATADGDLIRVDAATGQVTAAVPTQAPTFIGGYSMLGSDSLVASAGDIVVGANDPVRRTLSINAEPARSATGLLETAGQVWPGPGPGQWWVTASTAAPELDPWTAQLVGSDGKALGRKLLVPAGQLAGMWVADGRGGLLYLASGGVYRVDADEVHRLTTGRLLAVANGRVVTIECGENLDCTAYLTDIASGDRRRLPDLSHWRYGGNSALSSDGRFLAIRLTAPGDSAVGIIDLDTGRVRSVETTTVSSVAQMSFSPDGALLFAVDDQMRLIAVDTSTGLPRPLGIDLPRLRAVVVDGGVR